MYNYYHGNNFGEKLASHCTGTINDIICWTRANCYRESGSYKGVYVKDTAFFKELTEFNPLKSDNSNLVYNLMTKIINQTNRGNPVLKDSIPLNVVESMNAVTEFDDDYSMNDIVVDEMDNMGGSSQVECFLSQHREENDNTINNNGTQRNTYYKEDLPLFE